MRRDIPGEQIVVDVAHGSASGSNPIIVLDDKGNSLAEFQTPPSSRFHLLVDWFGKGLESIVVGGDHTMYDGYGKKVAVLEVDKSSSRFICSKGDMSGDGRADLILSNGSEVYIYKNKKGKKPWRKVPLGMEMNFTLY